MSQTVEEHIPATTLNQAGVSVGGVEEQKGETGESTVAQMVQGERDKETADDVSRLSDDDEGATEEIKVFFFLENTVFKLEGKTKGPNKLSSIDLKENCMV
jgi:hypothetical protein